MSRLHSTKTLLSKMLLSVIAISVLFLAAAPNLFAASDLVPDPDTITTSSTLGNSFYAELSDIRPGSNLQANQSYSMLSFSSTGNSYFRIGYCNPAQDNYCSSSTPATDASDVEAYVCALEPSPTSPENEVKLRIKDNSTSSCQRFIQPQQGVNHQINVKARLSPTNGRYNYMVLVQFYDSNTSDSIPAWDAATNGAIPFRIRAVGSSGNNATAGFFPYQRMDRTDNITAFMVADNAYLAIQNRNASYNYSGTTHKDQVRLTMRADCLVDPSILSTPGFELKWNDADAKPGSVPDNSDPNGIRWEIRNLRTNQVMSSNTRAFWTTGNNHANYMGGQDESRSDFIPWGSNTSGAYGTFHYMPGDQIQWTWFNVLANNGVNTQVPFDDYNIGGQCPTRNNSARCDVSGVPDTIAPGETKRVVIRVRNGNYGGVPATTDWPVGGDYKLGSGAYTVPTGASADDNGAYIDSRFWNAATASGKNTVTGSNRVLLTETIYAQNLNPGQQSLATFEFDITAPNDKSGEWPFVWQMLEERRERFGEVCVKGIRIIENRPVLRVEGSDLIAGAVFGAASTPSSIDSTACEVRRAGYVASGGVGDIKTNGFEIEPGYGTSLWLGYSGFSSSQYAAFARREISSKTFARNNFVANTSTASGYLASGSSGNYRDILFANSPTTPAGRYGNYYQDVSLPCVDVSSLDEKYSPSTRASVTSADITGAPSNRQVTYIKTTGNITLNAVSGGEITVAPRQRVVIFTEGQITINAKIRYTALGTLGDGSNADAPLLMLIAKGGINVAGSVDQLDGYYIAYNSTLNTCSNNNRTTNGACGSRLVVNGALAGKKIMWGRNYGTIGSVDDTLNGVSGGSCTAGSGNANKHAILTQVQNNGININDALNSCSSEYIKFSPEFYFSNPFSSNSTSGVSSIPEGSIELPPIY